MSVPKGTLPTGLPKMLWVQHPDIKFFYGTASKKYFYVLYRQVQHVWRWEVWTRPASMKYYRKKMVDHSKGRMQFHTAFSQANAKIKEMESV